MDLYSTICALTGLVLGIIRYEYNLSNLEIDIKSFSDVNSINYQKWNAKWTLTMTNKFSLSLSTLIFLLSVLSVIFLTLRNWFRVKWVN